MRGKLYGIGVGPGDPELMTIKAKRVIEEADIVAVPVKKPGEESVALNIAKAVVHIPAEKIREIEFTMDKDRAKREACRKRAACEVAAFLDAGKAVAMLTLGDIGIYSTYAYVHKQIVKAGYEVEMVSGIPSFCAGAGKANISLAEGNEGFGVIPSLKGVGQVEKALDVFGNLVIMKAGGHMEELIRLLEEKGLGQNGIAVSNVGMEGEYVGPLLRGREYGYFTTVIVKKEW